MKIQIRNNERVMFVGMTGSGKTFLAKHFLSGLNRVLIVDPKHTFKLDGFRRGRELPMFGKNFRLIYRPRMDDDGHLAELLYKIGKGKDATIYIDELATLAEQFPTSTMILADIARTGREKRVALWNAVQRPRWTPRIFFTETEIFFQFLMRSGEDRKYMAEYLGEEVLDKIPKFDFWYSRPDTEPALLQLVPGRGIIPIEKKF